MENELELKWRRIQQAMRQEEADGCLLTMNMNLYYVSGQVFNGYFYLPAEGRPYWFVKRLTVPETNQVHVIRKPEQMPELFRDLNLAMPRKLLLEADELSYNEYIRLQHVFRAEATGNASALIRHIRMIKTPWEIEQMRISARKHEAVYREIPACYRPGMRDIESGNYRTGPTGCIVSLWKYRLAWNERQNPGCPVPNCIGMLWQWPDKKGWRIVLWVPVFRQNSSDMALDWK